jgi:hypothetical protein
MQIDELKIYKEKFESQNHSLSQYEQQCDVLSSQLAHAQQNISQLTFALGAAQQQLTNDVTQVLFFGSFAVVRHRTGVYCLCVSNLFAENRSFLCLALCLTANVLMYKCSHKRKNLHVFNALNTHQLALFDNSLCSILQKTEAQHQHLAF